MRRTSIITAIVMALTLMTASVALADFPAGNHPSVNAGCTEAGGALVHGEHITGGYVDPFVEDQPAVGAAGQPAHFGVGDPFSPGASFCQGDNSAAFLSADPPHGR